ncbi:sulfotransferase 2B1-like [Kryptolebias marmoratus]|uniref:Sulfotransferase n=1 Tax=Kryptolebias marmoratus TaxID=37003 RepID=A0A3Q3BGT8_KRYMA|nr:sulfotransferase 2B1-like [Kryptolebias marmoratus]
MSSFEDNYLHYGGIPLPKEVYSEGFTFLQELNLKDDDVLLVTYPRTGTTWMQQLLPLMLNGGDVTQVLTTPNWKRAPWVEIKKLSHIVEQMASPRSLVTHLPFNLMPRSLHTSKAKVIYVMRNPRDVLVSSYFFHQTTNVLDNPGTLDEFIDKFLSGRVMFGKWTDHVKSWRHAELGDRIMFITYEEMVQDLPASIRQMSDFLCCNLSEEAIQKTAEHNSFKSMIDNPFNEVPKFYLNSDKASFLRKGIAGDWKNHLNSEQLARFTSVIRKELQGESFSLPWSLE